MIQSSRCRETQALFERKFPRRLRNTQSVPERKLTQLDAALTLDFLRAPPGKRLEALEGDRAGQYSVRIDDPCRICFVWTAAGPADVEIVGYH